MWSQKSEKYKEFPTSQGNKWGGGGGGGDCCVANFTFLALYEAVVVINNKPFTYKRLCWLSAILHKFYCERLV